MASADATIQLGEIFLETADGTRITLGQLKAFFGATLGKPKEKPVTPIQIGSTVRTSDNPKSALSGDGYVDQKFAGKTGTVNSGPSTSSGDWCVKYGSDFQWISPEHLTVVAIA